MPQQPIPSTNREASRQFAELPFTIALRAAVKRLNRPAPCFALLFGCMLAFACGLTSLLGPWAVTYKQLVPHLFMLFVVLAVGHRAMSLSSGQRFAIVAQIRDALPLIACFAVLMGMHHLVSNGQNYAAMSSNYWDADPLNSTTRRIGLPALSHVLGFDEGDYAVFWYAILFTALWFANAIMARRNLLAIERLSLRSSSIFAYAMIGPGYGEVFVVLLGSYCLLVRPGLVERIVVATLMIATHETSTIFVALVIMIESDDVERMEWVAIFAALYAAYVASFVFNWRFDLLAALSTAGRESPSGLSTFAWLLAYQWRAGLGAFIAYKLYWLPVLAGWRQHDAPTRLRAGAVLVSLILVAIGTDTSRLVQFGSLALIVCVSAVVPAWSLSTRRLLAWTNLAVPSLYVAVNAEPLWGNGLYALYLHAAQHAGLHWGRVFFK